MPKTLFGFTWMSPKSLHKEIEHSVILLSELFNGMREEIPDTEDLPTLKAIFEEQIAVMNNLFLDRANNIWIKISRFLSLFLDSVDRVAELEIWFNAHRMQWMAENMIQYRYLQEPLVIPACVNMLESMSYSAIAVQILAGNKTGSEEASLSSTDFEREYEKIHAQIALTREGVEKQRESLEKARMVYEDLMKKVPKL